MKILLVVLLSFSLSSSAYTPDNLSNIRFVLKHVETNHRLDVIGDGGKAYGILQIHKGVILDVNRYYGTTYTHKDAFDVVCAEEIFNLYIGIGVELFEKKYCRSPTEEEIVRMWNGGCYKGYLYKSTKPYYLKYLKYKKLLYNYPKMV